MNRHERISKALRGYAEMRVPEMADPWPEIRESIGGSAAVARSCSSRRFRLVPRTRAGLVFTLLLVALFSMGAYTASGLLYEVFQGELPGAKGSVFGNKIDLDQTQTESGAQVNVEWAYADASYVVVAYSVEDLREGRRVAGHPVDLSPVVVMDEPGYEQRIAERFPNRVRLSGESGKEFAVIDGTGSGSEGPDKMAEGPHVNVTVFAVAGRLDPSERQRFRLEIPLEAYPLVSRGEKELPPEPIGKPFTFDFEIPVRPAPIVEMNQKDTSNGLTLTLDRVVNSPGKPQAVVCFDPPNDGLDWSLGTDVRMGGRFWFTYPFDGGLEHGPMSAYPAGYLGATPEQRDRCHAVELAPDRSGNYSFKVKSVEGWPRNAQHMDDFGPEDIKTIRGPWTFEFEVPEQ